MKKGGILIISKDDANIYNKVQIALTQGKPILWYEDETTCYYIDTITLSGDDIVLTKGGKTITVTDANVVTESGDIQNHLYTYNFVCSFENQDMHTQYIYFTILSTQDLEINIDNLKTLIGDSVIRVSSTVNELSIDITDENNTLIAYISIYNGDISLSNIADENSITFNDFNIVTNRTKKVQLF